jgi:hypothetical protein
MLYKGGNKKALKGRNTPARGNAPGIATDNAPGTRNTKQHKSLRGAIS